MSDYRSKESQQELFTEFYADPKKTDRILTSSRSTQPILISTTAEQILLVSIISILLLCGVFFLGVLRGKSISIQGPETAAVRAPSTFSVSPTRQPAKIVARQPLTQQRVVSPEVIIKNQLPLQNSKTTVSQSMEASDPTKPYTIQLMTYRKKEMADNEINHLRAQGYFSFMIPSGQYFQVCAGQYTSKEQAKTDFAKFSAKYKDCFLRRRNVL